MIKPILDMMQMDNHYGLSERVEIAYGKYEYISSWKRAWEKLKRLIRKHG